VISPVTITLQKRRMAARETKQTLILIISLYHIFYIIYCFCENVSFQVKKRHLQEVLLCFFSVKKSAIESHQLLVKAYDKADLSETTCPEWFRCFRSGDIHAGRPKVVKDAILEASLDEDQCQRQEEIAELLGVAQLIICLCFKALGII